MDGIVGIYGPDDDTEIDVLNEDNAAIIPATVSTTNPAGPRIFSAAIDKGKVVSSTTSSGETTLTVTYAIPQ